MRIERLESQHAQAIADSRHASGPEAVTPSRPAGAARAPHRTDRTGGEEWRRRVGVTLSPPTPSSIVRNPSSGVAAAAGAGSRPCALRMRPDPSGTGPTVQRDAPISPISQAAATMSAIESQAPISWKRTSLVSTP